jgi:hypothetical protein
LYFAIVLDLCDGEIGRYRARSMSREEDFSTFVNGMYLDRMSHMALTPIWPLAIAWGLYTMSGEAAVFLAGLALASYHTACRARPQVCSYLREFFHERIADLDDEYVATRQLASEPGNSQWLGRLGAKVELWVRNGKRFNCMLLIGGLADCAARYLVLSDTPRILFWLFMVWGGMAFILLVHAIMAPLWSGRLESDTIRACRRPAR